jgi:hypothetical protein
MDARIFYDGKMGLAESSPMSLDERVSTTPRTTSSTRTSRA